MYKRQEMNEERIVYGQIRFVTFSKAKIVPKIEDLVVKYPNSEPVSYTHLDVYKRQERTTTKSSLPYSPPLNHRAPSFS